MLKTSFTNESAKNLTFFTIAKDVEIGSGSGNYKDETVKKLLSKNLNKALDYLTGNTRQAFM